MEDLYSNLDNYDDVNAVDELKNENRELKMKLEECSKTMNQLQKFILQDFDKLNSEYKKLEINYSSLLKTARAEIERKTQLITNLNKEKDMIVIKAMQGGCRNILKNLNKPAHNFKNDVKPKCEENKDILDKNRAGVSGNSREGSRESPMLLMKDNSIALSTNRSSSSEHNARQLDDGYRKENMLKSAQNQNLNIDKPKSMKISNRRKSMPVFSNGEEPTSEEDIVKDDYTNTRDRYKYQDYDNASHNSQYLGSKGGQRTSRFEQYSREPKQMYNRGKDRYNPHFDKYKSHNQNYDKYSPERGRQWQQRGNDYSHRSEHYRQRELESPLRNKYERSKSRDRRHRDNRWDRYEENYDAGNIREPDLKRRRMDSGNSEWERRDQAVERMSYRPSEYRPDVASVVHGSCQSPDYDQIESNLNHHSIKEIKNTATVQLEDPRINSNKYSLKESERGVYIATVDKNVDIIPVNKTLWGFEKVEVPEALKTNVWKEPTSEDIVNYIYTDIDDPAIISSTKCSKDDIAIPETLRNPGGQDVCRKDHSTSDIIEQKSQKTNVTALKSLPNDYKIPKKSTTDKKSITPIQEKLIKKDNNYSNKNVILGKDRYVSNKEVFEDKNKLKTQPKLAPVQHNVEGDLELSDEASDDELQITCKQNDKLTLVSDNENNRDVDCRREKDKIKQDDKPRIKDIMKITEDNKDLIRKKDAEDHNITGIGNTAPIKASIENNEKIQVHMENKKPCQEEASNKTLESCKKKTSKKKQDGKTPENKDGKFFEKTNQSPETEAKEKKKREKRKRLSSKETVQEKQESKVAHTNTGDDEDKPMGSKPRNKFTELFGDSSSLITPEDLNLPTKFDINIERNDNNYGSLFENTQDAIDINVREIKEVSKTKEVLLNVEALEIEEDPQNTANKKSLFEINDDHPVPFENLKPANIDGELGIVKTVVISTGTQPCIEENNTKRRNVTDELNNVKTVVMPTTHTGIRPCMEEKNTNQTNLTEVDSNQATEATEETEEVVKQQPLAIPKFDSLQLRAVATSTPNKMQHDLPVATTSVPNIENLDNDSNISYSASMATTNVEANSDAPDVRIFIKRRRKIKKV